MNKALFWDFDGTLVYPDSRWPKMVHKSITDRGYAADFDEVRTFLRAGYTWHTPEVSYTDKTGDGWWEMLDSHLSGLFTPLGMTAGETAEACSYLKAQALSPETYELYDDALPTLRRCLELGWKNYVISNNFPELEAVMRGMGIAEFFSGYTVSAMIGYEKPRPEIFLYALSGAGFPDKCWMIGDNPNADILGGRAAGMRTILVHRDVPSEADFACASLAEIPALLEK